MSKQDKANAIELLLRINRQHAIVISSVNGILFERDALEMQRRQDAVFSLCSDEEILAIVSPELGQLYDQDDIDMIRAELAQESKA